MFAGHLAVALAAKRATPRVPLAALVAAAFGLDLLWPVLLLLGLEVVRITPGITAFTPLDFVSYPWSHSLLMTLIWAALAGALAARVLASERAGVTIAVVVASHWVLDFVTHRPDLPLWPAGLKVGLGLWNSIPATIVVEGALLAFAITIFLRTSSARDRVGTWAFWGLIGFIGAIWLSGPWSPPPPGSRAIAFVGLALGLLVLWAHWIDRHRVWGGEASLVISTAATEEGQAPASHS
jgi:hypothetical protein